MTYVWIDSESSQVQAGLSVFQILYQSKPPLFTKKISHCGFLWVLHNWRKCKWWIWRKIRKIEVFHSSPFWNLNFGISKVHFLLNFWSFWDMVWKDVSFFYLDNQSILHVWASFHAKFGHKDRIFIWVSKCETIDSSPISLFLMIKH